jgi:hypothetical protein
MRFKKPTEFRTATSTLLTMDKPRDCEIGFADTTQSLRLKFTNSNLG